MNRRKNESSGGVARRTPLTSQPGQLPRTEPQPPGRASRGAIIGTNGRIEIDTSDKFIAYELQVPAESLGQLDELLAPKPGSRADDGLILTATVENTDRLRVLFDPPPAYERKAAQHYLRGDVLRISGTARSCNMYLTRVGGNLLREQLAHAGSRAEVWIQLRARIVRRGKHGPRCLVELVPDVDFAAAEDDRRLGAGSARLAAEVWPHEDFADWEESQGG